jgi:hypothetical protein
MAVERYWAEACTPNSEHFYFAGDAITLRILVPQAKP